MSTTEKCFRPGAIRELMESTGLSASELARKIGRSRQAVWAFSEGITTPQFATILKLADIGGRPLSFFIEERSPRSPAELDKAIQDGLPCDAARVESPSGQRTGGQRQAV